jgi:hypothetical protein
MDYFDEMAQLRFDDDGCPNFYNEDCEPIPIRRDPTKANPNEQHKDVRMNPLDRDATQSKPSKKGKTTE